MCKQERQPQRMAGKPPLALAEQSLFHNYSQQENRETRHSQRAKNNLPERRGNWEGLRRATPSTQAGGCFGPDSWGHGYRNAHQAATALPRSPTRVMKTGPGKSGTRQQGKRPCTQLNPIFFDPHVKGIRPCSVCFQPRKKTVLNFPPKPHLL